MEITIIHGQGHKGSTYHITEMIKEKLADTDTTVHEYFMPKDTPAFCVGCYGCIQKGEEHCPQAEKVQNIVQSMLHSEILVFDSPAYCCEMTGQMKVLFDHLAYMWMPHRPRKEMFSKIGIVISTTAGAGAGNVTKSMKRQLFWWGVPRIYQLPFAVNAMCFEEIPEKIKRNITKKIEKTSRKIKSQIGKSKPTIKTRLLFQIMRQMQKSNNWNLTDRDYWKDYNWLNEARPWS